MSPAVQRLVAGFFLVGLSPLLGALVALVWVTSGRPVLHRAVRVRPGGTFTLYKLRTMTAEVGPRVTAASDSRITPFGRWLRRTKLDELPQLWNVVRGDMLLVGPRPEDPRYVDWSDPLHQRVFSATPGITGRTALAFRDEEALLAAAALDLARGDGRDAVVDADIDHAYRERILPTKLAVDAAYLDERSLWTDLELIGRTIGQVLGRTGRR